MKARNHDIGRLLDKQRKPIQDHLSEALSQGSVRSVYEPTPRRGIKESAEDYAFRLYQDAVSYQFVRVVFNGESNYIAFGVSGPLVTQYGKFQVIPAQVVGGRWGVHYVLVYPDLSLAIKRREIFIRLDSGCASGQLFGDKTCDCKQQYELALKLCEESGSGVVINIPGHDGRGWAEFKMANQKLMDECGLDTVQAAKMFYKNDDAIDQRTYTESVLILKALGFSKDHHFKLVTNSPRKVGAFTSLGMNLKSTQSVMAENIDPVLKKNLTAKSKEWNHNINFLRVKK